MVSNPLPPSARVSGASGPAGFDPGDPPGSPEIVELAAVVAGQLDLVGGKAAGLSALIEAGERVPAGFCITTVAHDAAAAAGGRLGEASALKIVEAYRRLGGGPVAVRSSATAEDLPSASFAGQHDTVLDVVGEQALLGAVQVCWASLSGPRARAYREAAGVDDAAVRMAVVVQRMVDPLAAGVLFTANPITGCRAEMVVDAVAGLGDVVVDGSVAADHYVLAGSAPPDSGCLSTARLDELREAGARLQERAGAPQDVEWAFDHDGRLWLLQSRPITTLFPQPTSPRPGARVFFEVGHMQGMLRPFTPMGMSAMRVATALSLTGVGIPADPFVGHPGLVDIGGRMFLDITALVRNRSMREKLPASMAIYGPRVSAAVERVLDDPRFAPVPGRPYRLRTVVPVAIRLVPGMLVGLVGAILDPAHARRRALRATAMVRLGARPSVQPGTAEERIRFAMDVQGTFMRVGMREMLPPIYAGLLARQVTIALLAGVASESEIDETLRGMPHNITTEMDLALWALAAAAAPHRDLLLHTAPAELSARYRAGSLPDIGLDEFLRGYGHRGAAEVDVGLPRWAEDPSPVFAAIAGYLRVTDPEQAPDRRFARAAADAEAKIDELVARARRGRPVRARLAGFLMRRGRAVAGLRELPKFAWLYAFEEMRRQLLSTGAELQERGVLERADDIMFLDFREALAAAAGADQRRLVEPRRAVHVHEAARRSVPGVVLSDGTIPEALMPSTPPVDGALIGMAAAPGTATGRARVVLDPADARIEPGEILVAPTTDPGWTPLFLTAGGLVTETGSPMAHGPTVAREYGIPAVICVRDATQLISTGQLVTIDGAAGTVTVADDVERPSSSTAGVG
ncbi:pyruvate, water dikinase [Pseudonocardia sp. KRD-184]|uniref:Pyruvate, water dikinase n=1 Tax=Pseudonocardia oceani TaxID=2792013 RepID=A0ABS6UGF3_9PSEU|nr:PEP/pyruvate-binding domain-containing protein [Pseudonocardia oceani]MBW0089254.1 pyruvate, water dikinase [Pseudonocardia oceani]MBW0095917.1 pyruvate, water dikinase [Pseudonocardia oceani]MBW0108922.1 pyruvate, water dikinase [Pseudonocardia oceani]MBW0122706.1 pyruvate, water dikinase [Pseudonocardia oceani]MBW0131319.1 pyruvate, water dikinase [Pseudonocardia oceani]